MHLLPGGQAWAVGEHGTIWHSVDGGARWKLQPSGTSAPLHAVWFINRREGWIVGGETEPVTHREGGDPSSSRVTPSVWKFEPITLERGVTHDPEFENWAKKVWNVEGDSMISLKDFRKDLIIELLNEQGVVAKAYKVFRCWVSSYFINNCI